MPVIVAFASQKGGVGKSTLARALASVAASGGLAVTLVDLDPKQQTLMRWQQRREANRVEPALAVKSHARFDEIIAYEMSADLIVIDAPGGASRATLELAHRVHLFVQPSAGSIDDLYPGVLLFHELVKAGVPHDRLVFALCRTLSKREEDGASTYIQQAGYEILPGSIPERAAYREAHNQGHSLTETVYKVLNERADALMAGLLMKVGASLDAAAGSAPETQKKDKGAVA